MQVLSLVSRLIEGVFEEQLGCSMVELVVEYSANSLSWDALVENSWGNHSVFVRWLRFLVCTVWFWYHGKQSMYQLIYHIIFGTTHRAHKVTQIDILKGQKAWILRSDKRPIGSS